MSELALYSASQISTFDECERRWGLRYIAGIKTEKHASASLGTEIDDTQLQPYLRDGREFDYSRKTRSGYIAASALPFLPPKGSCGPGGIGQVQKHFIIPSPTWIGDEHIGFGFQGYMDIWLPKGGIELPEGVEPTVNGEVPPAIVDFKSTKDFKWAKSSDDLGKDTQAQLYAVAGMFETGARVVDLHWIYMRTQKGEAVRRVHRRVHASDVIVQFEKINERAKHVHNVKLTVADAMALPPNPDHCEAYGGCPYRSTCNLGPGEIADAQAARERRKREQNMTTNGATGSLFAKLQAQRSAAGAPPAVATVPAGAGATATIITPPAAQVGINPPETTLPPAQAVGAVETPPPAQTTAAPAEAPKRGAGPGRPPKSTTTAATPVETVEPIKVVWSKETFSLPVATFEVGPFEASDYPQPGETRDAARDRIYASLAEFAEKRRAEKATSLAKFLESTGLSS